MRVKKGRLEKIYTQKAKTFGAAADWFKIVREDAHHNAKQQAVRGDVYPAGVEPSAVYVYH